MLTPYVVITLVENGWTIAVNGVLYPQTFVAQTPADVIHQLVSILPDLRRRRYELSLPQPAKAEETPS